MSGRVVVYIAVVALIAATSPVRADVTVPAILGDHMVFQAGHEMPFWGWADPGEEVTVTMTPADQTDGGKPETVSAVAATDGRWFVKLPARSKMGTVEVSIVGKNQVTLTDVLIGDVWVCSGQSNMEWPVSASLNHQQEISEAKFPSIRVFKVERSTARLPQTQIDGKWIECSPETVGDISAVGYFFARDLHLQLKRPIGLIQAALSGANCEAWISHTALKSDEDFAKILDRAEKANGDPNQANNPNRASVLFNGMIAPLQPHPKPFPIKGTIWYQGESNFSRAYQYRKLFPALITDWRRGWAQGDFPFLYVQLPNYVADKAKPDHPAEPEESAWAELREAQAKALSLPKTGMVVTIDVGDARDVHPKNKQDVGHRLALSALRIAYGHDVVCFGPEFKSMKIVGDEVHLDFQHVERGLVAHGDQLKGFAIAGADKRFVWAMARIEGNTVIVSARELKEPVAVRYAWADNPDCNLFNQDGFPAAPFRTDDWPGVTIQAK